MATLQDRGQAEQALLTSFSRNLKAVRLKSGMSQVDLAMASGYTQAQISRLEGGQRSPDLGQIARLAEALEVPPHRLIR